METAAGEAAGAAVEGDTDIYIYPGFDSGPRGAMLTNFHLPQSSLLLLVCAFAAGTDARGPIGMPSKSATASTLTATGC